MNFEDFEPRRLARNDSDLALGNAKRFGDQGNQRFVGFAFVGRRGHPRLEDHAAVGERLAAFNGVTRRFRCQSNGKSEARHSIKRNYGKARSS